MYYGSTSHISHIHMTMRKERERESMTRSSEESQFLSAVSGRIEGMRCVRESTTRSSEVSQFLSAVSARIEWMRCVCVRERESTTKVI